MFSKISNYFQRRRKERFRRTLANAKAMKDDRWLALVAMGEEEDTEFAIAALLSRFDYRLDNAILDTREKEQAIASIMNHPADKTTALVKEHLRKVANIAWTVKILLKLTDAKDVFTCLCECLDFSDINFDRAKIIKNYDILCMLQDFDLSDLDRRFEQFLHDDDERVRFAAVELMIKQNAAHASEVLEQFLCDDSAENTRIRQLVLDAFIDQRWVVKYKKVFQRRGGKELANLQKNGVLYRR
ncbi:MAG: hypothetical protein OYH77_01395 [Pseudomonadota bacterium]|nr:hypothetical protein [Pseudomonadota bacterium]